MDTFLQNAIRLLQVGQFAEADAQCRHALSRNPADARALHVRGLAQRQLGGLEEAEALLRRSVELAPLNPEFRTNLAQLLGVRDRHDESCEEFERAIAIDPRFRPALLGCARLANRVRRFALAERHARTLISQNERDAEAWSALGTALFSTQRSLDAHAAFERAVSLAPGYAAARYHLAAVLCEEERSEEALAQIEEARRLGVAHRGLALTRSRVLMQLDRYDEADSVLSTVLKAAPHDVECQFLLAQLRHVRGDADFARAYRDAANRSDAPIAVCAGYADVMRLSGQNEVAAELLRTLLQRCGPRPELLSSLGTVLQATERYEEAVAAARTALAAQPENVLVAENYVAALLSAGMPAQALPTIERFRKLAPADQRWITYRADVARQCDEDLFDEWCDCDRLVRVYDLAPPPGYSTIDEFHQAVRAVLEVRHLHSLHPLDQSLRLGTQTSRGLLADTHPVVRELLTAFAGAVATYQQEVGHRATHPFLSRNIASARIAGCWSVKLRHGGFHVNHIHPQGWLSSAYYVSVPEESADICAQNGWLKMGEPRFSMPRGLPLRFVQPKPGRLVLFPSYLWHGTTPLTTVEPRLAVAFDAVPSSRE